MRRIGVALTALGIIGILLVGVGGCAGGASCAPAIARGVGLDVLGPAGAVNDQQLTGSAPLTLGAALVAAPGLQDTGRTGSQLVTKAELNFGDGAGWVDITAQQQALGPAFGNSLAQSVQHTYAAAGSYILQGRVTYWDGQVLATWNPCTVTVQ